MIETFMQTAFQETTKEGLKERASDDLPAFAKDFKSQYITDFREADKPLCENFVSRNYQLKDTVHETTGVPFKERTIQLADGEYTGVFPEFPHDYETKLDPSLYLESDSKQFRACNDQLKEAIDRDPDLQKKFSDEQIQEIKAGETPTGYTWHHHEQPGVMQLVDAEIHAKTGHTGGKAIWGGER